MPWQPRTVSSARRGHSPQNRSVHGLLRSTEASPPVNIVRRGPSGTTPWVETVQSRTRLTHEFCQLNGIKREASESFPADVVAQFGAEVALTERMSPPLKRLGFFLERTVQSRSKLGANPDASRKNPKPNRPWLCSPACSFEAQLPTGGTDQSSCMNVDLIDSAL